MNISYTTLTAGASASSKILGGLSEVAKGVSEAAKKVAFLAGIFFMKAAHMMHSGMIATWAFTKTLSHHAAELAVRIGKALAAFPCVAAEKTGKYSIEFAQFVKRVSIVAGQYIAKGFMHAKAGLQIAWVVTKHFGGKTMEALKSLSIATMNLLKKFGQHVLKVSQQVAQIFAKYSIKFAQGAAKLFSQAKAGLAQGFQITRHFFATHQKETVIAGCGIAAGVAIGAGVYYLANRFNNSKKTDTQTTAV